MDLKRFRDILIKNKAYEQSVKESLKNFHDQVQWDGDIPKIMKEIGKELDVFIIELPMKDSDFGACYLETEYSKYLLLNSNQPRNKMYFSFCHDMYHILEGTPDYINEKREVHFNQDYLMDENENKANLFAANLLMPDLKFNRMYSRYAKEHNAMEFIIIKLMNYFNAPFVAVLLRLYELKIVTEITDVEFLLNYDQAKIEEIFEQLWLPKEILKPSMYDEMPNLLNLLTIEGTKLIQKQQISEYDFTVILKNIKALYAVIKKDA